MNDLRVTGGQNPLFHAMTQIHVKVVPGADDVEIDTSGTYPKISVTAPASQGRANAELVSVLSAVLDAEVGIVSGHQSRRKKIAVDMPETEINEILSDYPG